MDDKRDISGFSNMSGFMESDAHDRSEAPTNSQMTAQSRSTVNASRLQGFGGNTNIVVQNTGVGNLN